jgi:adenylate cyclase
MENQLSVPESTVVTLNKTRRQSNIDVNVLSCYAEKQYAEGDEPLFDKRTLLYGPGILGHLDRVPPSFKILACVLFAIIGTVVFGIILVVERAIERNQVVDVIGYFPLNFNTSQIMHELQLERGYSSSYLGSKGTAFIVELATQRNNTDAVMPYFIENMNNYNRMYPGSEIASKLTAAADMLKQLSSIRNQVSNQTISSIDQFAYYNAVNLLLCEVSQIFSSAIFLPKLKNPLIAFAGFIRMKEMIAQVRGIGSAGINAQFFDSATFNRFYSSFILAQEGQRSFLKTATSSAIEYYNKTVVNQDFTLVTDSAINFIIVSDRNVTTISPQQWFTNMTIRINALKKVEDFMAQEIITSAQVEYAGTIIALTLYSVGFVALLLVASVISFILARSIVQPWRRMQKLQDQTMKRYVPTGFLKLMGRKNLSDVELGDYLSKSLDVFFADIRGFTSISEKMSPKENFKFLNEYLSTIGPIFRSFNGFIDKYIGDGIMALFPEPGTSLRACIEIQLAIESFNRFHKDKFPEIQLGIGVHTGPVICGLIGETGRVQGTIISDTVNTASRIESLTKRYGARIMTSKESLTTFQNHKSENDLMNPTLFNRYIGQIRVVGKESAIEMYEILIPDIDPLKLESLELFNKGIKCMFEKPYNMEMAAEHFKAVLQIDATDKAATLRLNQALEMNANQELLNAWAGEEILIEK